MEKRPRNEARQAELVGFSSFVVECYGLDFFFLSNKPDKVNMVITDIDCIPLKMTIESQ